jgi:hypothetical protein
MSEDAFTVDMLRAALAALKMNDDRPFDLRLLVYPGELKRLQSLGYQGVEDRDYVVIKDLPLG